jgi:hypothetical protein
MLAHSALTELAAWIIGSIQFIDEYYRELSKAKFGPTKAWHVTTWSEHHAMVFKALFRSEIKPRFVNKLKSHDVMASYKWLDFKNHPSIATELVKFLAINTSFEAINRLRSKTVVLELEIADFKKKLNEATKTASLAANKADEAKRLTDLLVKCVLQLKEKK